MASLLTPYQNSNMKGIGANPATKILGPATNILGLQYYQVIRTVMIRFLKFFLILSICFLSSGCSHHPDNSSLHKKQQNDHAFSSSHFFHYMFYGSEPFWQMEILNDSIFLFCSNKEKRMQVSFAEKSVNGNTIGFANDSLYGFINENWDHDCCYAITEKDSLPYEIIFVFEGKTYGGCGEKYPMINNERISFD